ncbi:GtrA family protein [Roseateles sp.]|uniref:GtrA family protein n=1 Tax=Roseateles sp. TaxID=1971397 RepID=UPI00326307A8
MPERKLLPLMGRHAWVGLLCALLNIGLVHAGTAWLHWPYLAAAWLTCIITIPTSYFLHRRHSFRLQESASWREFGRFVGQQLLQFCAGLALLSAGVEWLGLNPTLAMALATAVLWLFSFVVQWRWVFRTGLRSGRG